MAVRLACPSLLFIIEQRVAKRGTAGVRIAMTMTLEQIAEKARKHVMTPAERRARRVSLIKALRAGKATATTTRRRPPPGTVTPAPALDESGV